MFYYAKLNENQICISIETRARELSKDLDRFITILDYNETYLCRKWKGNQWSQGRYELYVDIVLQRKIKQLEEELQLQLSNKENERLKNKVTGRYILELTSIIKILENNNISREEAI